MIRRRAAARAALVLLAAVPVAGVLSLLAAGPAAAHPLGNFTVNRASHLTLGQDRLRVDHVQDLAEIPAAQVKPRIDADGDDRLAEAELAGWAADRCAEAAGAMSATLAGRPLALVVSAARASAGRGEAGLPLLRAECALTAGYPALSGPAELAFQDGGGAGVLGWQEVTAGGDRTTLTASDVPTTSPSGRLTRYPEDLLASPPAQRSAMLRFRPGGPPAGTDAGPAPGTGAGAALPGVDRFTRAFTGLVAERDLVGPLLPLALLAAIALGAGHALAPGHGKTMMAFYLAGRADRSWRAAATVGATVTAAHTAAVLALGVAVSAGTSLAPAAVFPWLSAVSGALVVAVGVTLVRSAVRPHGHGHSHGHPHGHPHGHSHGRPHEHAHGAAHTHPHDHGPGEAPASAAQAGRTAVTLLDRPDGDGDPHPSGRPSNPNRDPDADPSPSPSAGPARRTMIAMGVAGGLLPSPSALVVFLAAVALGRAWFGVLLVLAFGLGMALTLSAAGLLVQRAGHRLARIGARGRYRLVRVAARVLPVGTAAGVCGLGALMVVRSLAAAF